MPLVLENERAFIVILVKSHIFHRTGIEAHTLCASRRVQGLRGPKT